MARLFFIFWIRSNIFRDFSGCRLSILISEMVIRIVCPLAFQCRIPNYSTAKTREDMAKRNWKSKMIFWIRSNIFRNFSGCRRLILISEKVIRFVCPLAFQCRIQNCSTAKTREDVVKRKWKVENNGKGGDDSLTLCVPNGTIHSWYAKKAVVFEISSQALYCTTWYNV